MRALVFDGTCRLRDDRPEPTPAPGEALIGVLAAGVCRTDLEIVGGYMGFRGVLGHEFVGRVIAGPPDLRNRRVVGEINCPCGRCDLCARGLPAHCRNRTVLGIAGRDGAFAERLVLPVANLHTVPDAVDDRQAVFAEPLAAVFQILRQVRVGPDEEVVVLGDGRLGQLAARVLRTARPKGLLLVGRHEAKLALAERWGIRTMPLSAYAPAAAADVVVDATGTPDGFDLAMRAVRPRGTIVLKSTFAAPGGLNLAPLVIHEVTVVGSRCGPFDAALDALASGAVEVRDLVGATFPLARAEAAMAAAADGRNVKVLITMPGSPAAG
jgi:threonine dehydrogenase-like Zn-dependent dehydrogenase